LKIQQFAEIFGSQVGAIGINDTGGKSSPVLTTPAANLLHGVNDNSSK
jgi:hypothetical protein